MSNWKIYWIVFGISILICLGYYYYHLWIQEKELVDVIECNKLDKKYMMWRDHLYSWLIKEKEHTPVSMKRIYMENRFESFIKQYIPEWYQEDIVFMFRRDIDSLFPVC